MKNIILIAVLVIIVGSICFYLYKQKKQGNHCVGCPYCKKCSKKKCDR